MVRLALRLLCPSLVTLVHFRSFGGALFDHFEALSDIACDFTGSIAVDVLAADPNALSGIFYLSSCPTMLSLVNGSAKPSLLSILADSVDPSTAPAALERLIDLCVQSPNARPVTASLRHSLSEAQNLQSTEIRKAIGGRQPDDSMIREHSGRHWKEACPYISMLEHMMKS